MKISNLINKLNEAKEKYGDINVFMVEYGFGGRIISTCKMSIDKTETIYQSDLIDNNLVSSETIKELFLQLHENKESLTDKKPQAEGILLHAGESLYRT